MVTKLSMDQWEEVRDALTELEVDYLKLDDKNQITPSSVIKDVKDVLKLLVDTEARRLVIVELCKQADRLGLTVEQDEDTGEVAIYTGLTFKAIEVGSMQTFEDLIFMESEDDDDES